MIIGIDLGTTNSLVSVWGEKGLTMVPNALGEFLTPSVISFDEDGTTYIGQTARERLITHPESTFQEFKRDMGSNRRYEAFGKQYTATDLSAILLRQLKEDAEAFLGEPVEDAIISVPAYFTDKQRAQTRNAGLIAGLRVSRLVNEPSAAALYYHANHLQDEEMYIVFDFGGGTLDVTLVDAFDNIIEIQGISGDNHLGGADFNHVIALDICKENGMELQNLTDTQRAQIYRKAEEIKMELSAMPEVTKEFAIADEGNALDGTKRFTYHITTQHLVDISTDIFNRVAIVLKRLMNQSGAYEMEDISGVILVGGSSKMPAVRTYLYTLFKDKLLYDENPDEIVCRGVGTAAGIEQRSIGAKDLILTDICPFTLGTGIIGDVMSPVIQRNEVLPCSRTRTYVTVRDGQKSILFEVYQGEFHQASKNTKLCEIEVNVPPKPAGEVFVNVTFSYDINGIFVLELKSPYLEESVRKEIVNTLGLSEKEIASRRQRLEELKTEPPMHGRRMELLLNRAERLFAESDSQQKYHLARHMDALRNCLARGDQKQARQTADQLQKLMAYIESHMFQFDVRDAGLWEDYVNKEDEDQ